MDAMTFSSHRFRLLGVLALAFLFLMTGCEGDTGPAGPAGSAGEDAPTVSVSIDGLTATEMKNLTMTGQVTKVAIASPPVVTFWVKDQYGRGLSGLGVKSTSNLDNMRFGLAKLVPGSQGSPSNWVAYTGLTSATSRPSAERDGSMVDHGDGRYTYTFTTNVSSSPTNAWETVYEPGRTHRLAIQISGTIAASQLDINNPVNIIHDFVPSGGAVTTTREIALTETCDRCHGKTFQTEPHTGRVDTRYCVVCHTDQRRIGRTASTPTGTQLSGSTYVVNGEAVGNFPVLIHKMHMGADLSLKGYNYAGILFNDIHFPQDVVNCRRCHQQSAKSPQGDNWKTKPSRRACGACHDSVSFTSPAPSGYTLHTAGEQLNDFLCSGCHKAADIEGYHLTANATPNNPSVPTGLSNFSYEISSVTVTNTTQPLIKFRILQDGTPITLPTTTSACGTLLAGFTGSPSFLIAYARPQDGVSAPAEYNNLGRSAAQPATVSITNICNGTQGVLTGPDGSGIYTAQVTVTTAGFPSGSTMRAAGLQGFFTQSAGTSGITTTTARHAISVTRAVTSDSARRSVVDNAKCANCHEWLSLHGGNRVYDTSICVMCHVPNLSSSGRGADVANLNAANAAALTADGYNAADPLTWPEATNNFKDLIHRIHASGVRNNEFRFVRDRGTSGVYYYNWSDDNGYPNNIHFPGTINMCEICHLPGTYDGTLPAGVLASNEVTGGDGLLTRAAVTGARATVPNTTDIVTSPFVATCVACHDGPLSILHMVQYGASKTMNVSRATYAADAAFETCVLCHGAGRIADPAVVHPVK